MNSIHMQLKTATHPLHEQADALLQGGQILQTRGAYCEFLRLQLAFSQSWECLAAQSLQPPYRDRWSQRHRIAAIRRDLDTLGAEDGSSEGASPGACDLAQAWGLAYVLEGSALGGRVLARRIAKPLGLAGAGLSFLKGSGTDLGARWGMFLRDLAEAAQGLNAESIEAGAVTGFEFVLARLPNVVARHRESFGQTVG